MKLGIENRKELALLACLLVAAVIFVAHTFGGSTSAANAGVSAQTGTTAASTGKHKRETRLFNSLDPSLRLDLLKTSESTEYKGSGRNIFRAEPDPPPIPKPVQKAFIGPQPPPPPPPINLKFFGFASKPGEPKKIFLSQGDDVFIAREGDIVDRRYKVGHISANAVEIEDVLNNNKQTIPLVQGS